MTKAKWSWLWETELALQLYGFKPEAVKHVLAILEDNWRD